ncbi:MAG: polyphosphate kinase 2 family protein [Rhodospirillales bacterium]
MRYFDTYRIPSGAIVNLDDYDPGDRGGIPSRAEGEVLLAEEQMRLVTLQKQLHAEGKQALLVCLQAMDAAGKDGTIRHVLTGLNPQSCQVNAFVEPTVEELGHDFLWRVHRAAPRHGEIMVFNRSHYEDVLVARVHGIVKEEVWQARYSHINAFEQLLTSSGTKVVKIFLNISKAEQLKRFEKRLDDPLRQWKIAESDYRDRELWDDYRVAYAEALSRCATDSAPWFVVPANHKWFRNLVVARILRESLEEMDIQMPQATADLKDIRKRYHRAVAEEKANGNNK